MLQTLCPLRLLQTCSISRPSAPHAVLNVQSALHTVAALCTILPHCILTERCACVQGIVTEAFSGENKCTVLPRVGFAEYDPTVKPGKASTKKVPVCGSQSVRVGDSFSVVQVGTVGVVATEDRSTQQGGVVDSRSAVQHAALVVVRAANGSKPQCEVFTAEQMRTVLGRVAWWHSGLLVMDANEVSVQ